MDGELINGKDGVLGEGIHPGWAWLIRRGTKDVWSYCACHAPGEVG